MTSWTRKYWEILDHLYWSPHYLGLKSIPQKHWTIDGDRVSIPRTMTNSKGPLYRRLRSGAEYWDFVRRQEEVFAHIFDLTFAVLPGDVVGDVLHPFVGVTARHAYESLGTQVRTRYGGGEHDNVTTPDAFLVAPEAILAVELKFDAKTSLDQLAKYLMLFTAEERLMGTRTDLNLLYVLNRDPRATLEKQLGFVATEIDETLFERLRDAVKNERVHKFLDEHSSAAKDTLRRLRVQGVTWQMLLDRLTELSRSLAHATSAGDRTLKRLIDGLISEIRDHPLAKLSS